MEKENKQEFKRKRLPMLTSSVSTGDGSREIKTFTSPKYRFRTTEYGIPYPGHRPMCVEHHSDEPLEDTVGDIKNSLKFTPEVREMSIPELLGWIYRERYVSYVIGDSYTNFMWFDFDDYSDERGAKDPFMGRGLYKSAYSNASIDELPQVYMRAFSALRIPGLKVIGAHATPSHITKYHQGSSSDDKVTPIDYFDEPMDSDYCGVRVLCVAENKMFSATDFPTKYIEYRDQVEVEVAKLMQIKYTALDKNISQFGQIAFGCPTKEFLTEHNVSYQGFWIAPEYVEEFLYYSEMPEEEQVAWKESLSKIEPLVLPTSTDTGTTTSTLGSSTVPSRSLNMGVEEYISDGASLHEPNRIHNNEDGLSDTELFQLANETMRRRGGLGYSPSPTLRSSDPFQMELSNYYGTGPHSNSTSEMQVYMTANATALLSSGSIGTHPMPSNSIVGNLNRNRR